MASTDNLTHFLTNVADAIREKNGTSDPINAQNFADAIRIIPITEDTIADWGFTKNTGDYIKPTTGIPKSDLDSSVQTSLEKADTALQSYTEQYKGTVTGIKINSSTKNPSNGIVDLGTIITSHQTLKTINNQSIVGSGNITIETGSPDANIQAVETGDVIDDVTIDYATTAYVNNKIEGKFDTIGSAASAEANAKSYVDALLGDINSVLESIINGGGGINIISFYITAVEYQAEEGMTWGEWINSNYNTAEFYIPDGGSDISPIFAKGSSNPIYNSSAAMVYTKDVIESGATYNVYASGGWD